jgi:hypothetical protein
MVGNVIPARRIYSTLKGTARAKESMLKVLEVRHGFKDFRIHQEQIFGVPASISDRIEGVTVVSISDRIEGDRKKEYQHYVRHESLKLKLKSNARDTSACFLRKNKVCASGAVCCQRSEDFLHKRITLLYTTYGY